MKFLVVGAGAIGGVLGARLARHHDVTLVARGAHLDAIRTRGLAVHTPAGAEVVRVTANERAVADAHTIILLAVKTQDAAAALRAIEAPPATPIVCLTNGLEAERLALRWFERVYAVCVYAPCTHLEPGVVEAWGTPVPGMYDVGRYPAGTDDTCTALARAFIAAGMWSNADADIMRWKRTKLVSNLANAIEALCGRGGPEHPIVDELRGEAMRCFAAAGLATVTPEEERARRAGFGGGTIAGRTRAGGSTWQSLARGATPVESEYLNGEIALLGRLHGVPTPVNAALLREVTRAAAAGVRGSMTIDELAARLSA